MAKYPFFFKHFINISILCLLFAGIGLQQGKIFGLQLPFAESKTGSLPHSSVPDISLEQALSVFPEATRIQQTDVSRSEVFNGTEKIGEVLCSSPYTDQIIGFISATPLFIALTPDLKIKSVRLLPNDESTSFVEEIEQSGFLNQWDGLTLSEAFEKKADAISGATYTTTAIIHSFQKRLAVVTDREQTFRRDGLSLLKNGILVFILALAMYSFFYPARAKRFRLLLLLLSIGILGFWQGTLFSFSLFLSWIANGVPLAVQWGLFLVFLCSVLLPLYTGRAFYCVYLCPFGAAQELAGKISKKKWQPGRGVMKWLQIVHKAILIGLGLLLITGIGFNPEQIEPFSAFHFNAASVFALSIAGVSLCLAIFIHKPWCRFFCPTGGLLKIAKRDKKR